MNVRRVGRGRYLVRSESYNDRTYNVQVHGERAACDCIGSDAAERKGRLCKHGRRCIEAERKHMENTAVTVRDPLAPASVPIEYTPSFPSMDEMKVIVTMANHFTKLAGKMIPSSIKSSEEAFAVLIAGREWGLGPMESFANMHVINGAVAPGYRVLAGAVMRGDPTASFEWIERTPTSATARLHREGRQTLEVTYTIEDAERAGLTGKDNWKKYPTDMLCAKVVTRLCRLGGPDLITRVSTGVRGAPAVMRAIDESVDADRDELPELESSSTPPAPEPEPTPFAQLSRWLRAQRDELAPADFANLVAGINKAYPGALTQNGDTMLSGKGKLTDEQARAILDKLAQPAQSDDDGEQGRII